MKWNGTVQCFGIQCAVCFLCAANTNEPTNEPTNERTNERTNSYKVTNYKRTLRLVTADRSLVAGPRRSSSFYRRLSPRPSILRCQWLWLVIVRRRSSFVGGHRSSFLIVRHSSLFVSLVQSVFDRRWTVIAVRDVACVLLDVRSDYAIPAPVSVVRPLDGRVFCHTKKIFAL